MHFLLCALSASTLWANSFFQAGVRFLEVHVQSFASWSAVSWKDSANWSTLGLFLK